MVNEKNRRHTRIRRLFEILWNIIEEVYFSESILDFSVEVLCMPSTDLWILQASTSTHKAILARSQSTEKSND